MMKEPLDYIVNAIAAGAFVGFLAFIIIYASFANWRSTPAGRSLMYAIGALNLQTLLNTIHLFTGPYPGQVFVRIPVYVALFLAAWHLTFTLVQILRRGQPITVQTFIEPKTIKEKP